MKIITPTAIVLTCLLANAAAKKDFMPDHSDHGQEHIMTAADFDGAGAKMRVCPSGDCTSGKFMSLAVTSLTEYDAAGANVTTIDKFTPKDSDWTAIETSVMYGVNVSSTSFIVNLEVGAANIAVVFNLTASIFQGNATVEYGSQNLTVPAGALKFTVDISRWPLLSLWTRRDRRVRPLASPRRRRKELTSKPIASTWVSRCSWTSRPTPSLTVKKYS